VHRPALGDKASSGLDQLWLTATMLPLLLLATTSSTSASLPVVCWHGVNDNANSCNAPIREAREEIPDLYAVKVMIGEDLAMDEANSVLMRANDQVARVCEALAADPRLAAGYHGLGISQGGLLLRGVAQRCPQPPMRKLITFGSPHQGVFGVPECQASASLELCELVRRLLSLGAYEPWIQDLVTPAQYWHDPFNQTHFLAGSHYLADINNEREAKNETYRSVLAGLEALVLVQWDQDTTIIPKESAHFGFYSLEQDTEVVALEELPLYSEDWLGLAQLHQQGRLHRLHTSGDHMDFDYDWYRENIVRPFLV